MSENYLIKLHFAVRAMECNNTEEWIKEFRHEYPNIGAEEAEKIFNMFSDHNNYHVC